MAERSNEKEEGISYFIEDANLFAFWVLSEPRFYSSDGYFGMEYVSPFSDWQYKRVFDFLKARFELANVPFPTVSSYNDLTTEEVKLPPKAEELKEYSEPKKKKIAISSKRFMKGDADLKDIELLLPVRYDLYKWIYFRPSFSKDELAKLAAHIDTYIDQFLNNELFVYDRNYLTFEKQKEHFIKRIRRMSALENYGENFVITSKEDEEEEEDENGKINEGVLFVHTLYALQKLKYITVLRLWCVKNGSLSDYAYHANIVAMDSFIDEVRNSFRKENPAIVFKGYDEKRNLLKFAGKEIELSKKNKETDAVLLIKTLVQEPDRYWFSDEIAEKWDIATSDEASKNKVYFAARKINEAVKIQTGIDDFIDHNTKKFRINPKYLKVDE